MSRTRRRQSDIDRRNCMHMSRMHIQAEQLHCEIAVRCRVVFGFGKRNLRYCPAARILPQPQMSYTVAFGITLAALLSPRTTATHAPTTPSPPFPILPERGSVVAGKGKDLVTTWAARGWAGTGNGNIAVPVLHAQTCLLPPLSLLKSDTVLCDLPRSCCALY